MPMLMETEKAKPKRTATMRAIPMAKLMGLPTVKQKVMHWGLRWLKVKGLVTLMVKRWDWLTARLMVTEKPKAKD